MNLLLEVIDIFLRQLEEGTGNAVGNLSNLVTVPNNLLQGNIKEAGVNTLRFAINTTVGILGIFDPAAAMGFEKKEKEDYGQTLGSWGVGPGCYLVLPVLGPSTVRDTSRYGCYFRRWGSLVQCHYKK